MKSGLPWNLRGVDQETREAVIEAARRSGMTVGQWLNQVLAEDGVEHGEPEDALPIEKIDEDDDTREAGELAEAIERLTKKLGTLDEKARASIPGLKDRLDLIERHVGELSDTGRSVSERAQSLRQVAATVETLSGEVDAVEAHGRAAVESQHAQAAALAQPVADFNRVNEAISELDQRIVTMGQRLAAPPPPADIRPLRLDDIRVRLDALLAQTPAKAAQQPQQTAVIDAALRALESRIDTAKAQLEARMATREAQAQAQTATTEQIGRIEQRLAEIGSRIAAAEAERQKPKKEVALATAIREISTHQRNIDDRAETLAMRRDQKALSAAMGALRTDINGLAEQVNAISRIGAEEHGAFFELARRIDVMAADKPLDRNLLNAIRGDLETMRGMVEGSARQDSVGNLEQRHDGIAAQLNDLLRITPDRQRLDALGAELASLRDALEADDSPRAISRLEMRMAELARTIEVTLAAQQKQQPDPAIERLEGRLQDISSRIETLNDPAPQAQAIAVAEQRLQNRMEEIANRLGGLFVTAARPQTVAIETAQRQLEGRLEVLTGKIGDLLETKPETGTIEAVQRKIEGRLDLINHKIGDLLETKPQAAALEAAQRQIEERLADINARLGGIMDTRPQTEAIENAQRQLEDRLEDVVLRLGGMFESTTRDLAIEHVHGRLQAITERIETLSASQHEPSAALDAIKSEIGSLRSEIAGKAPPLPPNTDHLESQIKSLASQIETVASSQTEAPKALAELEAQVAHLASELEQTKPRAAALGQVEQSLDRLQLLLADTAQESIASARAEARKAVDELSEMVAGNETDSGVIRGLMRDLDSLRNAANGSDHMTRSKLESVSHTMAQVVERLSALESETTTRATGTYGTDPGVAKHDATTLLWKSGFRPAADLVENRKSAPAVEPEKKGTDRRADFIAAARRAAQAAAQEAASLDKADAAAPVVTAPETDTQPAERRPGAFARISQAIRSRKRPLLLAAAAIVLAIGAMQIYGKLSSVVSDKSLIAATDVATTDGDVSAFRDVVASNAQPTVPSVAAPALVPPSAVPDAGIAFAAPEGLSTRFAAVQPEPAAADAVEEMAAADSLPLVEEPAAAPAEDIDPIVLASAEVSSDGSAATGIDSERGSDKLLAAANNGDPAAAFEIATRYAEGQRVAKDLAKAAEWYTKAAAGGVAVAQYRLASLYERGQGVTKDLTSAVNWYQRAADQGNVNAMHNLAVLMSEGVDGGADHDKALQWFLAAGNYGVRDSQYNLGVIFARGLGTPQDLVESYKWFAIAAAQGDTDASARRDEVAKAMTADDLAKARVATSSWHVKAPIAEANAVAAPGGGWDGPGDTIGESDRQALVKKIQTLLADAGYDPGPADGVAGPKTVDAVRAYQRTVGAPETGEIDKSLMASLTDSPM